jgi:trimeric autotransporter adhesin
MFASRRSVSTWLLSALFVAASLSCGGDSSTGPSGSVSKIAVTPSSDSLSLGGSVTLSASALDGNGHPVSGAKIFWNTENSSIATVSSSGVVTGIAVGNVRIAASSNGVSGFSAITVTPPSVASVRVTPSSAAITVGGTVHMQAAALDAGGNPLTGRTVTWTSDNEGVATVDNTGLVTGIAIGATTITATVEGKSGTAGIALAAQVAASISVAPSSVSITVGQTSQLTPTVKDASNAVISGAPVTWSIDNGSIATVSSTGLVTGLSPGTATVTATSGAAHTTVSVTVAAAPPNAVIVSPSSVSLLVTQRQQLTAVVTDAGGHTISGAPVTWSSNNSAVAAVGTTGLVIAILPGTATITATSGSVSGTASITVSLVPVRKVSVTPDALSMIVGDAQQLTLTLQDSADNMLSPTGHTVLWSSSSMGVATVTAVGLLSAIAPGAALITAKVDALIATATVTVTQVHVATVTVTPALDTLKLGGAVQLTAVEKDASGNPLSGRAVSWASSDESVVIVTSSGRVVSQGPGSATITATSEGKIGSSTIVVLAPVATVAVAPDSQAVDVGSTVTFTDVLKDGSGNVLTDRTVVWSSSDPQIATIDANGVATGVASGTVTITATSEGKTGTAQLTVNPVAVGSITVTPPSQSIVEGTSTTTPFTATDSHDHVLMGHGLTWTSSDITVATIENSGKAHGLSPGTVTITAASGGMSGTASLIVTPVPVATVAIDQLLPTVLVGSTVQLTATTRDASNNVLTGRAITWGSSDEMLATVDNTGLVTGVALGSPTITATSEGQSGTVVVSVLEPPQP